MMGGSHFALTIGADLFTDEAVSVLLLVLAPELPFYLRSGLSTFGCVGSAAV